MSRTAVEVKQDIQRLWSEPALFATVVGVMLLLALFVLFPLFKVLRESVVHNDVYTFGVYADILSKGYNRVPLINSLKLGAIVAVLGTAIGFAFAYAVGRTNVPFKRLFRLVATFPIISPPFVVSLAAILLFGNNGFITKTVLGGAIDFNIYGLNGLILVETLAYFPTAFLTLLGVLQAIDPALEDAAYDMGASKWRVFRTVTLPLAVPGIASSLLLVFAESLADFGNPLILAGNYSVLSTQAYLRITGMYDLSGGAVLAVLLLVPSVIAFLLQRYWVSRKSYVTVTGKPSARRAANDEPYVKIPLLVLCLLLTAAVFMFYGMVLFGSFVTLWGVDSNFTLANYGHVLLIGWEYIKDTLILSTVATPITGILGMVIAFLVVRKRFVGKGAMELASMLTFAVPGTVVGIGYILAFNEPPLILTGTAAIIVLLFVFRNAPVGIRAGIAALQQIDPSIEEAANDLGAGTGRTFRTVTLPLMLPAFFSGLAYSFVKCMTAISAIIFVVSGRWNLITVAIMGSVENADLAQAAAFCIVIIVLILIALGLIQLLVNRIDPRPRAAIGRRKGEAQWEPSVLNSGA